MSLISRNIPTANTTYNNVYFLNGIGGCWKAKYPKNRLRRADFGFFLSKVFFFPRVFFFFTNLAPPIGDPANHK